MADFIQHEEFFFLKTRTKKIDFENTYEDKKAGISVKVYIEKIYFG